jgi:hypothetical protein
LVGEFFQGARKRLRLLALMGGGKRMGWGEGKGYSRKSLACFLEATAENWEMRSAVVLLVGRRRS